MEEKGEKKSGYSRLKDIGSKAAKWYKENAGTGKRSGAMLKRMESYNPLGSPRRRNTKKRKKTKKKAPRKRAYKVVTYYR